MKQGGPSVSSDGFTIVETMIVLVITATLAIAAFAFVANRQNRTQFQVASNNARQQMEQIINETNSGFFPASSTLQCDGTTPAGSPPTFSNGSGTQGSNTGCVFLGKVILMAVPGGRLNRYTTYPIAGRQFLNGNPTTKLSDAVPTAVAPKSTDTFTGLQNTTSLQNGLELYFMKYAAIGDAAPTHDTGAWGYISKLQDTGTSGGAQQFQLYAVGKYGTPGSTLNSNTPPVTALANSDSALAAINDVANYIAASEIDICLTDNNNQSVLLQIGDAGNAGSSTVTQKRFTGVACT